MTSSFGSRPIPFQSHFCHCRPFRICPCRQASIRTLWMDSLGVPCRLVFDAPGAVHLSSDLHVAVWPAVTAQSPGYRRRQTSAGLQCPIPPASLVLHFFFSFNSLWLDPPFSRCRGDGSGGFEPALPQPLIILPAYPQPVQQYCFRATATTARFFAFFFPFAAISIPHLFRSVSGPRPLRIYCAHCTSSVRK